MSLWYSKNFLIDLLDARTNGPLDFKVKSIFIEMLDPVCVLQVSWLSRLDSSFGSLISEQRLIAQRAGSSLRLSALCLKLHEPDIFPMRLTVCALSRFGKPATLTLHLWMILWI